jgi:hypothetical protein
MRVSGRNMVFFDVSPCSLTLGYKNQNSDGIRCLHIFFFSPWSESVNELYRPSDRRLLAK